MNVANSKNNRNKFRDLSKLKKKIEKSKRDFKKSRDKQKKLEKSKN